MKPIFDKNGLATESGNIRCFYYDENTNEYIGWSDEYINLGVSMPSNSTDIEPDQEVDGMIAVFVSGAWRYEEDNRGEIVYSTDTGEPMEIDYIGKVRDGFTRVAPSTPFDRWDGQRWVIDEDAKHTSDVLSAEKEKEFRINEANEYINRMQWPGKASLGRLKETEKAEYNKWIDYLDELFSTDTSTAPMVNFPNKPE